ncbi:hypothetical protein AMATHDRAFT_8810 [Amanita thiersii Skay4041]|uniref:Uncharacterized protein n=1 Tax=Amanita thiersii Skay4041 TaxID=703135 RepID=A0A2A9ND87_9AGAR|nr:hypothetical protein AMATHDRAFT_8810 [Amanita thiersii Skay4041]
MVGFRMIAIGLVKLISGQIEIGLKPLTAASAGLTKILKGENLVGKSATAFTVAKVLGMTLTILGVIVDIRTVVWDVVEESKQCG